MGKDLTLFLKIEVTKAILSSSGKTPCCMKILNRYFIVKNNSLETALTMFYKISYKGYFLDFKEENASCNSSSQFLLFLQLALLQSAFTCSKLTTEKLEQGVKYVQS